METVCAALKILQRDVIGCRRCQRLIEHCRQVAAIKRRAYLPSCSPQEGEESKNTNFLSWFGCFLSKQSGEVNYPALKGGAS